MRKLLLASLVLIFLSSCASVLNSDLMREGMRDFSLTDVVNNPDLYRGKLFVLGGIIAAATVTQSGSLIEAIYVPVDSFGYFRDVRPDGRFLALYPREQGLLDPLVYGTGKHVTLAACFTGTQQGKIGQMDYIFPSFRIAQIYLWRRVEYVPPPYYYPGPYWGSSWGPPWGPPWRFRGYPDYWY